MLINHANTGIYYILDLLNNETILCLVQFNTNHINYTTFDNIISLHKQKHINLINSSLPRRRS